MEHDCSVMWRETELVAGRSWRVLMAGAAAAAPVHLPGPHDTLTNTLADMLVKLLMLSLLALATLSAARAIDEDIQSDVIDDNQNAQRDAIDDDQPALGDYIKGITAFKTLEAKLVEGVELHRNLSFMVPIGQCGLELYEKDLCGEGHQVTSAEVSVVNPADNVDMPDYAFPHLYVGLGDNHVYVWIKPCRNVGWYVKLGLACQRSPWCAATVQPLAPLLLRHLHHSGGPPTNE